MSISFGLRTNTQIFVCTETTLAHSIVKIKENEDAVSFVGGTLLAITGHQADALRLRAYASEYSKMLSLRNRVRIGPSLVAGVVRDEVYRGLRTKPKETSTIVAGVSDTSTLELFSIDGYGCCYQDNFVVSGYGTYFLYGTYDLHYKAEMNEEEALLLVRDCLKVLKERIILETDRWRLDVIDINGSRSEYISL